ncbi:hypothetical protein HFP66_00195 [Bacillus sp. A17A.1]
MEEYFSLLYMEKIKQEKRGIQIFNQCQHIFSNIIEKKSVIQKIVEDMDPLVKDILSKFLRGSCSIKEYLTASEWPDWVLDLNRDVGLFNKCGQRNFLPQTINDLSKIRIKLKAIELKTLYVEKLLLSILEETRQVKSFDKSKNWTNKKCRNEIISCIKIIIAREENIKKKLTRKKVLEEIENLDGIIKS